MYDYRAAMQNDICTFLKDNPDVAAMGIDSIEDELWAEDSITGNGSYYYDSEDNCRKYVGDNLDLLFDALYEFDVPVIEVVKHTDNRARYCDCLIRCYLLSECIYDIMGDSENE